MLMGGKWLAFMDLVLQVGSIPKSRVVLLFFRSKNAGGVTVTSAMTNCCTQVHTIRRL